jgi:hypothetical protein
MTSIQLSKATSPGPNLLHQLLQGGERSSFTNADGNTKWNIVFRTNTQIASERLSMPPWSLSDVNFGPAFDWKQNPPPLRRKLLVPLPLVTPPLNSPPGNEGARITSEAVADPELLTVDDARSPFLASEGRINEATTAVHRTHETEIAPLIPRVTSTLIAANRHTRHIPSGALARRTSLQFPACMYLRYASAVVPALTPRSVREWYGCAFPIRSSQCTCRSGPS